MVRLRGLPVVVAGHTLDSMQLAVGAWGSFLVVPPWWADDGHFATRALRQRASVATLGRVNLAFYVILLLYWIHSACYAIQLSAVTPHLRNITDVDDKINDRAARDFPGLPLNEAIRKVTEQTGRQFHADVDALGCLRPTVEPRATEHIGEMHEIIERLVAGGFAYSRKEMCGPRGEESCLPSASAKLAQFQIRV